MLCDQCARSTKRSPREEQEAEGLETALPDSLAASTEPGPFAEFYAALLAKGIRPEMARLNDATIDLR
jgi:hypothetical protein